MGQNDEGLIQVCFTEQRIGNKMISQNPFTLTIAAAIITTSVAFVVAHLINISRRLKAQKIGSHDKGEMPLK